ncbi:MAG: class I SAM-dependent methyltransferase [Candidatus Aureabacteria bacterium]|nr:class I SAM-dependent methyltransferase [Candidatus Auribacterota bacterium]
MFETAKINQESFDLIKGWTRYNRPEVEPDHQVERYAWLKDSADLRRILSIGCGEAKVEEYFFIDLQGNVDHNYPIYGIDINPLFIKLASERWPCGVFSHNDISNNNILLTDDSFSTIILGDVIEHIHPAFFHKVLSEAIRVCAPGGHILITFPNGSYFGDNNSSSIYSSDHSFVVTEQVAMDLLMPPDKNWWVRDGKAKHNFSYNFDIKISKSKRFLFVDITPIK